MVPSEWELFLLQAQLTPRPQCAVKIKSMKYAKDTIENRSRDFPACSAVAQPTAAPLALICGIRVS